MFMASYIIDIDDHSQKAKRFLEFLKDYASDNTFVQIEKSPNKVTRKAINEAQKGKTFKAESAKALFDSI
jgi:hypothetical protein